jgi:hypothetical protein
VNEPVNRDNACLDIFWLRDESLEESDNLPNPDVLAQEIVVPRVDSLGTTLSQDQATDRVEGSMTSKPPANNSAKLPGILVFTRFQKQSNRLAINFGSPWKFAVFNRAAVLSKSH